MRITLIKVFFTLILFYHTASATDYYVSPNGSNDNGNGTKGKPWKTIGFAIKKIPANGGHTLNILAGTYFENSPVEIPLRTNIEGAGIDLTIIKASQSFYYHPENPGFEPGRFLLRLDGTNESNGSQTLKGFTIDGSAKQLHGGIYVHSRNNILIENVKVQYTNFSGIWILKTKNTTIRKVTLLNCAWGSEAWCSAAFQFAYIDGVEIDQLNVDENKGYGIKSLGHEKDHIVSQLKLHDSRISVTPKGLWQNGKAPNISIEIWANAFPGSEIYNCYVDNHISLVSSDHALPPTGKYLRVHHNIIDIKGRAKGEGYGIELTIHDAEIDHNIFIGGFSGISNWADQKSNWRIHHNVFYGLDHVYPTAIINAYKGNLKDVSIYNNTVELSGNSTINFLECNNGGVSENVTIRNNLIINSNASYRHYPNRFISLENGATIKNLIVENNVLFNLPLGEAKGTFKNNMLVDPKIKASGTRPFPYYVPADGSPLIDGGLPLEKSYHGSSPDIGAFESK